MRPLRAAGGTAEVLWDGEGWTPHRGQGSVREVSIWRSRCQGAEATGPSSKRRSGDMALAKCQEAARGPQLWGRTGLRQAPTAVML